MIFEKGKIYINKKNVCPLYFDFLLIGTLLSCFLNLQNNAKFCVWQLGLGLVLWILYGEKRITSLFLRFVRSNLILTFSFFIWVIWGLIQKENYLLVLRTFSMFFIIFLAYAFAFRVGINGIEKSLKRLAYILMFMIFMGVIWTIINYNPLINFSELALKYIKNTTRLTGFWLHPIPAACFIGVFLIVSLDYLKGNVRSIFVIGAFVALLLTQTRSAWASIFIVLFITNYINMVKMRKNKLSKKKIMHILFLIFALSLMCVLFKVQLQELIDLVLNRLFEKELTSDMSYIWRFNSIQLIFQYSLKSGITNFMFGHGMFSGGEMLKNMNFGSQFTYNVGTVDNSFLSALYDYGLIGFIWLIVCFIWVFRLCCKKNENVCIHVVGKCLLFLLCMANFFEELYWCNTSFIFFSFVGIALYVEQRR